MTLPPDLPVKFEGLRSLFRAGATELPLVAPNGTVFSLQPFEKADGSVGWELVSRPYIVTLAGAALDCSATLRITVKSSRSWPGGEPEETA